jgi:hypothetical protein
LHPSRNLRLVWKLHVRLLSDIIHWFCSILWKPACDSMCYGPAWCFVWSSASVVWPHSWATWLNGDHQSWHGGSYTSSQWDICCLQNFRREFWYSYSQRYQCEKSMASVSRFLTFLQSGCRCSRVPRLPLPQQLHADLDTLATSSVTSVQFLMVGPICNTLSHLVLCNIRKPLINFQRWIACNLSIQSASLPTSNHHQPQRPLTFLPGAFTSLDKVHLEPALSSAARGSKYSRRFRLHVQLWGVQFDVISNPWISIIENHCKIHENPTNQSASICESCVRSGLPHARKSCAQGLMPWHWHKCHCTQQGWNHGCPQADLKALWKADLGVSTKFV